MLWVDVITINDINKVGGKNASLGEMISNLVSIDIDVPKGFATSSFAFLEFLKYNNLEKKIDYLLNNCVIDDINSLTTTGETIRNLIIRSPLQPELEIDIRDAFKGLEDVSSSFAVRSSATAEDLPDASFAGQQETYLNISGIESILDAIKHVFASLYNDRAISYRVHQGYAHKEVSISAGIQRMVRSDIGASGVMFTLDTESGFDQVVFITSSYGLGETVVQGAVNPDEFYVHKQTLLNGKPSIIRKTLGSKMIQMVYSKSNVLGKQVEIEPVPENKANDFSLSDKDIELLAQKALLIEEHYEKPMDIEWAKDGISGKIYIVQARPETVKSRQNTLERYVLKSNSEVLLEGRAIGQKIGSGKVRIIKHISEMNQIQSGEILVTDMTDPDWEPVMKRASAIITNRGGRTCHAAIISRELGVPAVVGCGNATSILRDGDFVTVSCSEGDTGYVYSGILEYEVKQIDIEKMPPISTKMMMNIGNPDRAFSFSKIPNDGIGLARTEFIINRMIGIHPKAILEFEQLPKNIQKQIEQKIWGYNSPRDFYVSMLTQGISTLAAAFYPKKVIVRLSDFKSNEYANLIGGDIYEPKEENPMLGYRGAGRYISEDFQDCFALECDAIKNVRDKMGFTNVEVMIPFVRTVKQAAMTIEKLKLEGLERGKNGLRIIMMCEVPSNALLADEFLKHFDGFSIGSNDLTQLTLGLDRDSGLISEWFDERDDAVKQLISLAIKSAKKQNKYVGICGQGPSDHSDFAYWLKEQGIDSLSLNPDTVISTWLELSEN
ncbi:phosphoenolpyruvate synthase [Vibrio aestuarianus subsp. cardii]|uniref:phosphoenolpyruvate synthase n=1 Tax=Vibrio aestuarianus TaxID=28171 RepID=UPI0015592E3C|nr:phosphoenolpyruvate synthase [Vibrio aestuarianus]NGZ69145.1 phosphoenolpyruvate synthase [Vibrio aestuarianus subsp. cardii]